MTQEADEREGRGADFLVAWKRSDCTVVGALWLQRVYHDRDRRKNRGKRTLGNAAGSVASISVDFASRDHEPIVGVCS